MSNFTAVALAVASFLTAALCLGALVWVLLFARRSARWSVAAAQAGTGGATAVGVLRSTDQLPDAVDSPPPGARSSRGPEPHEPDEADEPTHPNLGR